MARFRRYVNEPSKIVPPTSMLRELGNTKIFLQDLDNNGDFWNRMEIFCRDLTNQFSDVRIISGPMWRPEVVENNQGPRL